MPRLRASLLLSLVALAGCDFSQREALAPTTTFALALEDGPTRYTAELPDARAEVTLARSASGVTLFQFAVRARSAGGGPDREGLVQATVTLTDSVLARGRFEAERASVAYTERHEGTETRYAFGEALLVLDLEVVTEGRLAGQYRATASGPNGRTAVSVSGLFDVER